MTVTPIYQTTSKSVSVKRIPISVADPDAGPIGRTEAAALFRPLIGCRRVVLAVSGGPDSMALLLLFSDWRREEPDAPEAVVATMDHGIRPESRGEAEHVAAWAKSAGLGHETLQGDAIDISRNVQGQARRARYDALRGFATEMDADMVLTAHHRDDQAETVLIRLARGSGVDGLAAMAERTDWAGVTVFRPFIAIPKERLVATLDAYGHPYFEDPSNDADRFLRARVRKMMPQLAREGLTRDRLAATAHRLRRARTALEEVTAEHLDRTAVLDPGGFATVDATVLVAAPEEISLRALSRLILVIGGGPYPAQIDKIEGLFERIQASEGKRFAGATLGGCRIAPERGRLLFVRELVRAHQSELTLAAGQSAIFDGRFHVSVCETLSDSVTIRPLGVEGWALIGEAGARRALPAVAGRTLPGFFAGDDLIAAPHAEGMPARFAPLGFRADLIGFGARG
ncbi:MAG: tRNA lysidine(34) synthetase TilS [Pseudomonadota bacterium]